jgi:hypothetical protein
VVFDAARAVAALLALAVKPATAAPVVRLSEATFRFVTPLIVLNRPATKSLVPSGEAATSVTPPPPKAGRKLVSIRPVRRLNDARLA